LGIPDVDPDNRHVRFQRDLDDARFRYEDNVVEQMVGLENVFNFI